MDDGTWYKAWFDLFVAVWMIDWTVVWRMCVISGRQKEVLWTSYTKERGHPFCFFVLHQHLIVNSLSFKQQSFLFVFVGKKASGWIVLWLNAFQCCHFVALAWILVVFSWCPGNKRIVDESRFLDPSSPLKCNCCLQWQQPAASLACLLRVLRKRKRNCALTTTWILFFAS